VASRRPRLLDLFCGAGGAAVGYHRAGWDVVGVDVVDQPRYPFRFRRADALAFPLTGFAAIHASPPCHDHTALAAFRGVDGSGWMLEATLARLAAAGVPWIVENVDRAHFHPAYYRVRLCGSSFGLGVRRHRWFASNVALMAMACDHRRQGQPLGVYGSSGGQGPSRGRKGSVAASATAMGIDWMTHRELAQAIPPAYTEHLGRQLLATVRPPRRQRPTTAKARPG